MAGPPVGETKRSVDVIQEAPDPEILRELVEACSYRPGWAVTFDPAYDRGQGCIGATVIIIAETINSHDHHKRAGIGHLFPVPAAAYNEQSWRRWLFDRFCEVERHEACEFFEIAGHKPYAPHHGPGADPYIVFEHGTDEEVRTSFRGAVKDA